MGKSCREVGFLLAAVLSARGLDTPSLQRIRHRIIMVGGDERDIGICFNGPLIFLTCHTEKAGFDRRNLSNGELVLWNGNRNFFTVGRIADWLDAVSD